ncbi:ATP-dependent RNA helicase RhlB [Xanthomonas citri pv. citri]|uniref:ATP-dependent RNA helicase RhlB n=15 Tax=Xanthomonas TaxID=338 RepID=RHLB_XANAC|nr:MULTISPECIES: ATP-dependent RNA helicase RhlB [Xanthomonas]Q8PFZ3.1 RecName: Full=ATP-dependent RNA helicase RhlB [Xanthomonas citri pv. citri str. 306]AAM38671.1 ATP-dependent RNA helicase [Xanthomonas citri pv. citri str. 306]AGH79289.1 ATP-dependent RNA helicase RhlB [Xanthomonas axonopodis Xac29-1]AGI10352.1 Superfamily II DNA and RNA helicase [Xanthomonas citri subsp. citri Aw12879]AKM26700.1 ATP-dependent RNA helicase RhlB [Xanthomonas citri pv. citri]APR09546.1 ATP-dependent RNA hel
MSDKPLTDVTFSSFDLHPALIAGLESAGFTRCTPIQALTLPVALPGGDVAGQAQTGTGKTLAFLVAVMNRLLIRPALADRKPEDPRALILAPTRELAIQIHKDAVKFGADLGLRFALVYGGVDYDKQRELLQQGVDVIIATPGRLIDYVKQHKVVSLHACEICVLDEADRMFDLGFIKDIRFLLRRMPERGTRQTLLFSATLSHRVLELAYEHMNEPEKLVVETESITAARVRQRIYFPSDEEKQTLLLGLLSRSEGARTMVFVNTKAFVERVARTLERHGYRVGVLSGDVPQKKRESLLNRFQKGQLEILVATDVAARGLHIDGVKYVYNYDLPFDAEDYVHRIGRTARLGEEGDAISFACERYAMSLPDIEAYIEQKIPVEPVTSELLTPLPRAPRVPVEGEEADDDAGDSVGTIFREAREQRAAEEQRRGGGRGGPGGSRSGSGGGRRDGAGADGKPRPRRKPRVEGQAPAAAASTEHPVVAAVAAQAPSAGVADAERAPRKRRRRRNGRPVEGAEPALASTPVPAPAAPRKPTQVVAKPVRAAAKPSGSPSLLSRIGRRLRSLVSGN